MKDGPDPKSVDQPEFQPNGRLTQNGLFMAAVRRFRTGKAEAEIVRVFEKIRPGIWVYNGLFRLVDAWQEASGCRQVFKFKLQIVDQPREFSKHLKPETDHDRVIPSAVKLEVWKRDRGGCAVRQQRKPPFRPHYSVLAGWFVQGSEEHTNSLRQA